MHELSLMQSALDLALERARNEHASRVHSIRLRVGVMSGVVPESLSFAFDTLAQGTAAEAARLEIENVPIRFWCSKCQAEFEPVNFSAHCPVCGEPSSDLRSGRELELAAVEIDR